MLGIRPAFKRAGLDGEGHVHRVGHPSKRHAACLVLDVQAQLGGLLAQFRRLALLGRADPCSRRSGTSVCKPIHRADSEFQTYTEAPRGWPAIPSFATTLVYTGRGGRTEPVVYGARGGALQVLQRYPHTADVVL